MATIIPLPGGASAGVADALRDGVSAAAGRLALPETTASGHGSGFPEAPRRDWQSTRIGPVYTEHEVVLAAHVTAEVLACCGVPPIVVDAKATAGGAREGYRQLTLNTLAPLAALIGEECGRVLESDGSLTFHELAAGDVAARSKSLKFLKDAGVPTEKAMELVGW